MSAIILILLSLAWPAVVRALEQNVPAEYQDVGVDEKLDAQLPLDLTFSDEMGRAVTLRDCVADGKPAVLQLGYFGCPMLCDTISQGLLKSMQELDLQIGKDFNVIYISFDPRETRVEAYRKKLSYVKQYDRPGAGSGWKFLVGKPEAIKTLTEAVGYKYKWVEHNQQYSHPAVLMVLTPEGHVSRYLYGVEYPKQTLQLSLVEASAGKIGSTVDRVLMFCYQYDHASGKYTFAAYGLVRLTGILTMLALGTWIVRHLIKERRAQAATTP